jgi:hypothetical protein
LGGLLIGVFIKLIPEIFFNKIPFLRDDSIKSEDDVEKSLVSKLKKRGSVRMGTRRLTTLKSM